MELKKERTDIYVREGLKITGDTSLNDKVIFK